MLNNLKVGDTVDRCFAGFSPMKLKVSAIDDKYIHCSHWKFDKVTGAEIDEDLGWDKFNTGSYLRTSNDNQN